MILGDDCTGGVRDGETVCSGCLGHVPTETLSTTLWVCPHCDHHLLIGARQRVAQLLDPGTFEEWDSNIESLDFLDFHGPESYARRLRVAQAETSLRDAILTGGGTLQHHRLAIGAFDFRFMGGSMGSAAGEKIYRLFLRARSERRAVLVVMASGGARMQEGIFSLMQMAKVVVGLTVLKRARLPYLSLLTHPTTGGVAASIGMLSDIAMAEPDALIGFAGPRVIEQTIRVQVPRDAQRAETVYRHGLIDIIVHRRDVRERVATLLASLQHWPAQARSSNNGRESTRRKRKR